MADDSYSFQVPFGARSERGFKCANCDKRYAATRCIDRHERSCKSTKRTLGELLEETRTFWETRKRRRTARLPSPEVPAHSIEVCEHLLSTGCYLYGSQLFFNPTQSLQGDINGPIPGPSVSTSNCIVHFAASLKSSKPHLAETQDAATAGRLSAEEGSASAIPTVENPEVSNCGERNTPTIAHLPLPER